MGGLTSLLLLLCVGVTVSTVLDLQKRTAGGVDCGTDERRYHVKLVRENGDPLCGGSLLKNDWILTAAHCWEWGMKVHIGSETVMITDLPVMYDKDKKRIHDIMLLKVPSPDKHPKITPVDLPADCKKHKPKPGDTVKIAGSVPTTDDENEIECGHSEKLQCADIKLSNCPKTDLEPYSYNHWFCGDTSTVHACPGYSGGGVVFGNVIYGVISLIGEKDKPKFVGFMDVCEYKDWIKKTTKKGFFSFR